MTVQELTEHFADLAHSHGFSMALALEDKRKGVSTHVCSNLSQVGCLAICEDIEEHINNLESRIRAAKN